MEKPGPFSRKRVSRKHSSFEKLLLPADTDQEFISEQDDTRKEMVCTFKKSEHCSEISDPVGGTSTPECEDMVGEDEDQENFEFGSTSVEINNFSKSEENIDHQIGNTAELDDNISESSIVTNSPNIMYDDAVNPSALEKEPATAVSKKVLKYLHLKLIVIWKCMQLVWQGRHIFTDHQINAAVLGMKSWIFRMKFWIFCRACFVTHGILLSFILAQFCSQCMVMTYLLNTLWILFWCHLSQELLAIGEDDNICCVFCAKEVPVKNVEDLKNGQHLTRPGQFSWCFLGLCDLYKHHMLLKDIVFNPDQTVQLILIHMTKLNGQFVLSETTEFYVSNQNLNIVQYNCPKYSPEAIINLAESRVNSTAKPESYNLFYNNCETVIRELMLDSKISLQVRNFFEIIATILMFIFCIASCFISRNIGLFTIVTIFFYCILISLAVDLRRHCKKDKIICRSHMYYNSCKIFLYVYAIGWITYVFISFH